MYFRNSQWLLDQDICPIDSIVDDNSSYYGLLHFDNYVADMLLTLQVLVRIQRMFEVEHPVHDRPNLPRLEEPVHGLESKRKDEAPLIKTERKVLTVAQNR